MKKICKHLLCIALILALLGNGSILAFATQDAGSVAVNTTTQQVYDDISVALLSASNGDTVRLNQDTSATILTILSGTTLDLNGCKLDATYTSCFGHIVAVVMPLQAF